VLVRPRLQAGEWRAHVEVGDHHVDFEHPIRLPERHLPRRQRRQHPWHKTGTVLRRAAILRLDLAGIQQADQAVDAIGVTITGAPAGLPDPIAFRHPAEPDLSLQVFHAADVIPWHLGRTFDGSVYPHDVLLD
jgi:hypothetical protein